jgi:hypothetical protein
LLYSSCLSQVGSRGGDARFQIGEKGRVLKGSERVTTRKIGFSSESALVFCCYNVSCDRRQDREPGSDARNAGRFFWSAMGQERPAKRLT